MRFLMLAASLPLLVLQGAAPVDVYDGFESAALSKLWETDRFAPGAVVMQSKVVHAGHGAAAITVHARDVFEAGQNGNSDSERAELLEARSLTAREGHTYAQAFSMFFPSDFPIVPVRLVIAQWKQYCGSDTLPCEDDSPVLAIRYIGGVLRVTQDIAKKQTVLFERTIDLRNRWVDFRFQTRFTPAGDGMVKAWMDGTPVVDFRGITANPENAATGYAQPGRFYFKMGLYRNVMTQPMTVYVDEYRKRELVDQR